MMRKTCLAAVLIVVLAAAPGIGPPDALAAPPVRALAFPAPGVQGLAYGNGSLWATGSFGPGMAMLFELDPVTGNVRNTLMLGGSVGALAHDGAFLYATADLGASACGGANPNRIDVLDAGSGALVRSLPSPVTGEAGGLALLGSRLFAAGALDPDPCAPGGGPIAVVEASPADGSRQGSFNVSALGTAPRQLAADGLSLLYGTWAYDGATSPPEYRWTVFALGPTGDLRAATVLSSVPAPDASAAEQTFSVTGMAWGADELFVANATLGQVQVFAMPATPPPPPPPPPRRRRLLLLHRLLHRHRRRATWWSRWT